MFSYYGSKSKLVKLYPPPKHGRIVELFAGSAQYSIKFPENEVTLIEIDPVIVEIWNWLIGVSIKELSKLPKLKRGDDLRRFTQLSSVEKSFMGFAVGFGRSTPGNVVTPRADATGWSISDSRYRPNNAWDLLRRRAIELVPKIRHWKIRNVSWDKYKINPVSTWFVDPPYQNSAGRCYRYHTVDYVKLRSYCRERNGLVIICEGAEANWENFQDLKTSHRGSWRTLEEKICVFER